MPQMCSGAAATECRYFGLEMKAGARAFRSGPYEVRSGAIGAGLPETG